ncbi:transcription elongation factor A N-terminal and central domain-containing protein [Eublepharis macularius]|uniref:Transcription elongation factor A N-terminal and central domain-containing protein n=1 Tax=Eublepharis macularius TaxID=481883 RepID=A0AA97J2Z1_EUBMA|nr:transcription elongation factor A N-terminal and central domain-containing protein [Eublepharis macularius]
MSNKTVIATRANCIEKLLSEKKYQNITSHLAYLEALDITVDNLQETGIANAVYRILKNCPSLVLKNKAKHLLSKWKTFYKNHHQTEQKPVLSDNGKESSDYFHVVGQNANSSEKLNQNEILGTNSCLPSESYSKDREITVQKDHVIQHSTPVNEKSPHQDHVATMRYKCTKLLYEALIDSSRSNEDTEHHYNIAKEIEEHIFEVYAKNDKKYKNCIRSKVSNLKNPKNSYLKHNLFSGTLNPKTFANMTVMEMAHDELKQLRASYTESSIREHQLPQNINGTSTSKIKCRQCDTFDCTVTAIARGALFLPSWVRNTSADEQMMTYVICNGCGEQWYHSRWICL